MSPTSRYPSEPAPCLPNPPHSRGAIFRAAESVVKFDRNVARLQTRKLLARVSTGERAVWPGPYPDGTGRGSWVGIAGNGRRAMCGLNRRDGMRRMVNTFLSNSRLSPIG